MYAAIADELRKLRPVSEFTRVSSIWQGRIRLAPMPLPPELGSEVTLRNTPIGLVSAVTEQGIEVALLGSAPPELVPGARVILRPARRALGGSHWIGRIVDPDGAPLDGRPILRLSEQAENTDVSTAMARRGLGARLTTGVLAIDTLLPLALGQRLGLFAGSGIGKSTLLAEMAKTREADVVVYALIGERGRDLRTFVTEALDADARARSIVIAATSDRPPHLRVGCLEVAVRTAELLRDQGKQVLLLVDSITRFAEAEQEIRAVSGGVTGGYGLPAGFPARLARLCERIGPGAGEAGDITAVLSVLVSGGDMDEPVADLLRGLLDGHVVLSREIAERGRFPAIDVTRSVSRSLPDVATAVEADLIAKARRLISAYDEAHLLVRSGLYVAGGDPVLDAAVARHDRIEEALSRSGMDSVEASFAVLRSALGG